MEALLSFGGFIASAVLDNLVGQVTSDAIQQFGWHSGLQDDLRRLRTTLLRTRLILKSAEKRRTKDENLAQILQELKDAAYDTEDLLDEFEYQVLQQKAESQENQRGNFLSSSLTLARNVFNRDDDVVAKVREVMGRLDSIANDMEKVIRLLDLDDEGKIYQRSARRETSSFLTEPEVFGREREKELVIKLLLKSGDATEPGDDLVHVCSKRQKKDSISILPVVGIGGIGKTTLAQFIYNDPEVHRYFELKIWVCVSDNFDVKRLTKEIIESVTRERLSGHQNLNCLQEILKEKIMLKRFLLVLDDSWNDDPNEWHRLCAPLRSGLQGSKILVTTRSHKVAEMMGTMEVVFLEGLANDAYWEFFNRQAFGSQNPKEYLELEAIARKIADRLKGSPLAAKTLGGLLNLDLDERHWRTIMDSKIWELKQREDGIMPVLQLSYQYLSGYLKQCVAYCSIFPKGYSYRKDELVQVWMAQGFIVPQGNVQIEEVGSEYFHDLLGRSFFQHSSKDEYVMHDLIHDLVQSVSTDEYLRIEDGNWQEIPSRLRYLSIYTENLDPSTLMNFANSKNLRTLVFFKDLYDTNFCSVLDCLFTVSTKIRVLKLRNYGIIELPESIGNLKHLRYLDVSFTYIRRLPESLCSLYNLEVLNISGCPIENFPTRMTNLVKLRQLKADEETICKLADIGKLTSLQELRVFKVVKKRGHKIEELKDMIQLRGRLCIKNLESIESEEEASQAKLNNKQYLDELTLEWNFCRGTSSGNDDEVLEGLKPHSNLRRLEIRNYGGVRRPSWLEPQSLKILKAICLENIQGCGQRTTFVHFPFLEILCIKNMHAVKQIGLEVCGSPGVNAFPLLKELEISDMLEWEEWFGVEGIQAFPRLLKLHIQYCPKLRGLPCLPPSLRELSLENVGINMLPESWDRDHGFPDESSLTQRGNSSSRTSSISHMRICQCPNLVNLEQWLLSHHLPAIRGLSIIDCQKVVRLPMERFKDFLSLIFLEIRGCPMLPSPVQLILPSSLQWLILDSCGHLDESLPGCLHNLTSLTRLELVRCPHITSLPAEVLGHIALTNLTIRDCGELRSLGDSRALRSLEHLDIGRCPQLTVLANEEEQGEGSARLRVLHVDDTALIKVLFSTITQPSLQTLQIIDSTELILFAGEEQLWLQGLKSLRCLYLENCNNLQSLPTKLHSLSTLQRLTISNCPEIRSLPEKGLPSSLEVLDFDNCHPVLTEQLQRHRQMMKKSHIVIW